MQLASRDGIVCDQCSAAFKMDFTYYSFDYRLVTVIANRRPALREILNSLIVFSLDICPQCYDTIKKVVVRNYQSIMNADVRSRGKNNTMICEISGKKMEGANYDYYLCCVTEVKVTMNGQPNICTGCSHQTYDNDKSCVKCNGTSFTRLANITTYDRLVEINICEESFKNMVNKAESVRKTTNEWSTKS